MSRMTKERRADLEKLADEDPHICLLRELLNEIDALQRESAQLLKELVRLLQEVAEDARKESETLQDGSQELRDVLAVLAQIPESPGLWLERICQDDAEWLKGHRALEATKKEA